MNKLFKEERYRYSKIKENEIIPVFYAADINYLPYLSVSLLSLKENRNQDYQYKIYILNAGMDLLKAEPILKMAEKNFAIEFVNVSDKLNEVGSLQLRDYYTGATYYRIFIANMFPEYDKAIYVDSDTVILGDVSKLYQYNLKDNLVGAVTDKVVSSHLIFKKYTKEVLGIEPEDYFNAGVLLMNLKKFRTHGFYDQFKNLLLEYKFVVAQDQDYLNVICKDKVLYLPYEWNTMPIGGKMNERPSLIHFNLTLKPWHYAKITYGEFFWEYVAKSEYASVIRDEYHNHSLEAKEKDVKAEANLIALAEAEINREDNYIKTHKIHNYHFFFKRNEYTLGVKR